MSDKVEEFRKEAYGLIDEDDIMCAEGEVIIDYACKIISSLQDDAGKAIKSQRRSTRQSKTIAALQQENKDLKAVLDNFVEEYRYKEGTDKQIKAYRAMRDMK